MPQGQRWLFFFKGEVSLLSRFQYPLNRFILGIVRLAKDVGMIFPFTIDGVGVIYGGLCIGV